MAAVPASTLAPRVAPPTPSTRDDFQVPPQRFLELWPPLLAFLGLLVLFGIGEQQAWALNGGHVSFPIDDAYGHLAIAKNLVHHGLWTFNAPTGFSSAASSLLWPVLIAGTYAVFGVNEWSSLVLNVLAAGGLLWVLTAILRRHGASGLARFVLLAAVVFLTPLPALVASGMEHTLQTALAVALVYVAARLLAGETSHPARVGRVFLPILACLLVLTRYEGLFLVGIIGGLLLLRRRWLDAVLLGLAAALPVALFGWYSLAQGWYFLPNSLLLKGSAPTALTVPGLLEYFGKGWHQLWVNTHLLRLFAAEILALLVVLAGRRTLWQTPALVLGITIAGTLVHLQLASTGWFYRYEAYLIVLGLLGIGLVLVTTMNAALAAAPRRRPLALAGTALLAVAVAPCAVPLGQRAMVSVWQLPRACHNIFQQQYQMALFFRDFYAGRGIAVNDIGAISFLSEVRLFDIFGLADVDVLRAKRARAYGHEAVRRGLASHGVRAICVYDIWAGDYGGLLPEWVPVGSWSIPGNTVCAWHQVTFYAPEADLVPELAHALQSFAPRLPADVVQEGAYRGARLPLVRGTYARETDVAGPFYWTPAGAQFFLYPPAPAEADVTLWVRPMSPGQRLDIVLNGATIHTRTFPPEVTGGWVPTTVKLRWQEGLNILRLAGHGEPIQPPNDGRRLLFGLREPMIATPAAALRAE